MRSIRLTSAVAAAAAVLGLAPAGAQALVRAGKHASPLARCHISIFAEPHVITGGESVQVFGVLGCPAAVSNTGQPVTIYQHTAGTGGFQALPATVTGAGGVYSIVASNITANSSFYARALGVRSPTRTVKVAPQVTFKGPAENTQLRTGLRNRVLFSGTVSPANAGAIVVLQRENATSNEEWHVIQRGVVGADGSYALSHRFAIPGDANLRVVVRPHGHVTLRGISNTLSYSISQRQNPHLTLNASADPISFGQSVTLSGKVVAGGSQALTLWAHTVGGKFAPVSTTTSSSSGDYSFTQVPPQSTAYRVTGNGIHSAILFEGVKYGLTAGVSANTVASGGTLTFSGTVAPARVGHVVYLERQNAFGGGFHVADVGVVAANGTYTIPHAIFGAGNQVFRVKVPGDPANQAIASAPFSIEVTPAPPGSLRPRPQSRQPSTGQV